MRRVCIERGCNGQPSHRGRCPRHARTRGRATHRNRTIYNSKRWQVLRNRRLYIDPLCATCGDIATDVDHIVPIERGGPPYAMENTQSLCAHCHGQKTRREQMA